jgi:hypothetical protein
MIEIATPTSNSICNIAESDALFSELSEDEISFYESIKPALKNLVKEPSTESIQKIMAISKSL